MERAVHMMILVEHHRRHVPTTTAGQREGRALRDVGNLRAIERVAVLPDHRLMIDRRRFCRTALTWRGCWGVASGRVR
jgi:hypothetical protein